MKKSTVIFNHIPKILRALSEDALVRAAMAGGQVVGAQDKINTTLVFGPGSTGGSGLGGSIFVEVVERFSTAVKVHIGPSVVYGRIQELGGIIRPVLKKMLSWTNVNGERIFAFAVHLPARPYLRPAMDEHLDDIRKAISFQIQKAIQVANK